MALEVGSEVWVPCTHEVWRAGVVVSFEDQPDQTKASPLRGKNGKNGKSVQTWVVVEVKVPKGSGKGLVRNRDPILTREEVRVPQPVPGQKVELHLRNEVLKRPEGALQLHDLGQLPLLHEPAVLHALELRFRGDCVYTLTGPMLLAVNPFRALPKLYGFERLHSFIQEGKGSKGEEDQNAEAEGIQEPHIFGVAKAAYDGVWHRSLGQTVLVSGESGAGKTETTKFVMRFLALAGAGGAESSMSVVERQVLDSIPVLEALGNAKTLRNENSSRFGKYIELQFCPPEGLAPRLIGAHTHTYLLEKVRVVHQQQGERSFHIFYQLLAAAKTSSNSVEFLSSMPAEQLAELKAENFSYLRNSKCFHLDSDTTEEQTFLETLNAMRAFGLGDDLSSILSTLLAVLYLGNLGFRAPTGNSEASEVESPTTPVTPLARAAQLLGLDAQQLASACCKRTMQAPGEGVITMTNSVEKAIDSRDSLARHLYDALFTFVVSQINATVSESGGAAWSQTVGGRSKLLPFVGVLDIFGFEFFEQNSLEQLFINFTNELLQQYFNEVIFKHEADLYRREGISWDPLDFPDNHVIVDLVGGKPGKSPLGILPMLDEECITTGGSSEGWCSKMQRTHGSNPHFEVVKLRQNNFIVHHFAGPVEYTSKTFVEKNRDALGADLVKCMKSSSMDFISKLFRDSDRTFGTKETVASTGVRRTKAKLYTVSSEFRGQLQNLMERIRATEPHFVRCIKPNQQNIAGCFERRSVVQQLQYQGVLQAIEVSRVGFPVRLKHRQAVKEFICLTPDRTQVESQAARGQLSSAARILFEHLSEPLSPSPRTPGSRTPRTPRRSGIVIARQTWAVGKSLVFLKREAVEALSHALSAVRRAAAVQLQAFVRFHQARKRFDTILEAVRKLQANGRGFIARRTVTAMRKMRAVVRIQSWRRGLGARSKVKERKRAIGFIQAWGRARRLRWIFARKRVAVPILQSFWRSKLLAIRSKKRAASALTIQRLWRGHRGIQAARRQRVEVFKRYRAARLILKCWRSQVSFRVLEKDLDEFLGQAAKDTITLKIQSRLQEASDGELQGLLRFLQEKSRMRQRDVQKLQAEEQILRREVTELNGWTFLGILKRLARHIFEKICPRAPLGNSIELGQPLLDPEG
ncbi:Myosin-6 (AtMYA2) [Durusdinium trenchii]|uniref:Myosin-6 (AtMYA2) n=1 Tax=Durusdinium trenchii TaxID=1381693 RepID=A0ABP0IDH2_9DINO